MIRELSLHLEESEFAGVRYAGDADVRIVSNALSCLVEGEVIAQWGRHLNNAFYHLETTSIPP